MTRPCDTSRRKSRKPLALDPHEALQVVDAGDRGGLGQVVLVADQPQAAALRAEQRLEHQRTVRRLAPHDRARRLVRLRRPGRGRRNARARKQEARHRLVDAALDRAGIVPHQDADLAQRMQHAEPHRHGLESAARHGAHHHGVGKLRRSPESKARTRLACRSRRPAAGPQRPARPARRAPCRARGRASPTGRPRGRWQIAAMRSGSRDYANEASSRSKFTRPARKLAPVSSAVTMTSAGLNSIGSIA